MKINLVSYAHGEPYETTQKLLNDSIKDHTSHEVILLQYSQGHTGVRMVSVYQRLPEQDNLSET